MYCRVLAWDFDGTSATEGRLAAGIAPALAAARARGILTMLVTGRVLEEIQTICPESSTVDAVVAENGAVLWLPLLRRTFQLGDPPPNSLLVELRARHVPFHAGDVVVGTYASHASEVLDLVRILGLDAQLTFNRGSLMLLPSGINKATGVRRALAELGRSRHNLIAFGDAENDLPMLAAAELAVTVPGASPCVAARADVCTTAPDGKGVREFVRHLLDLDGYAPTPGRHRIELGRDCEGKTVTLSAAGANVVICGDPHSGKSWLAGLLVERLLEQEYRVCVIDPEGEHLSLAKRPHTLLLGRELALPEPSGVAELLRSEPISLVLNLAGMPVHEQKAYVTSLMPQLRSCGVATGIPHWVVVDEAHYFFPRDETVDVCREGPSTHVFATYKPSLLSATLHDAAAAYLMTSTALDDERYFLTTLLQAKGPAQGAASDLLAQVGESRAGLLTFGAGRSRWQAFTPGRRMTGHAHHARKYADGRLTDAQSFRFLSDGTTLAEAYNLRDFHGQVRSVPLESLRHHLLAGDFSRWANDVLGDVQLAHGLRRIERNVRSGAMPVREEILAELESEYRI
jgi:hypothetical protein